MSSEASPVPLGPEDRAILAVESPTVAGHTCKVVLLDGDPGIDALRERIAARLPGAPMLGWRLGGTAAAPAWEPAGAVDLERHVTAEGGAEPRSGAPLRAEIARLFEQRLDRDRPLWHMAVLPRPTGPALVWRVHHALADGSTVMRLAERILFDHTSDAPRPVPVSHQEDAARRHRSLAGFVGRELVRAPGPSPFDRSVGARREVGFAQVALAPLHAAAKADCGATVNDVVVTLVGGALRRWILAHGQPLGALRIKIPVSLHHGDDLGNRDSFFCIGLPLGETDPLARLRAVHAETQLAKAEHDAETMDSMLRALGALSPRLRTFAQHVEADPRSFALNVSNVPGPRTPVSVLGAPVPSLFSLAEIGERHALRVAVVSVADRLCFGFCADPAIVDDVQSMADAVEQEAGLLVAAAGRS